MKKPIDVNVEPSFDDIFFVVNKTELAEGEGVAIPTEIVMSPELSWEAKGLLAFLLSYPSDFKHSLAHIREYCKEGKKALRILLKELETHGLVVRQQADIEGRIEWVWLVSDTLFESDPFLGN